MKKLSEVLRDLRTKFTTNSGPSALQRREAILNQPIEPNGSVFPDSWSAHEYKKRLENAGMTYVEGTQNGMPFVRPQTKLEFESARKFFADQGLGAQDLARILDNVGRKAKAGELTEADLYRRPKK